MGVGGEQERERRQRGTSKIWGEREENEGKSGRGQKVGRELTRGRALIVRIVPGLFC